MVIFHCISVQDSEEQRKTEKIGNWNKVLCEGP